MRLSLSKDQKLRHFLHARAHTFKTKKKGALNIKVALVMLDAYKKICNLLSRTSATKPPRASRFVLCSLFSLSVLV